MSIFKKRHYIVVPYGKLGPYMYLDNAIIVAATFGVKIIFKVINHEKYTEVLLHAYDIRQKSDSD